MSSNGKKISFLFNKLSKKPNAFAPVPKEDKSVEFIDCLEGTEIKVKNAIKKIEKNPLVIPIVGDANNIVSQIERESLKNKKVKVETLTEDLRPDSELTIEELAARQLLREARNKLEQNKDTTKIHSVPLEENVAVQDGIEPSMDDYENVPIEDFGLACLRGMGWKEGMSIGKNQSKCVKPTEPNLRPKGLGLGAQKILDIQNKDVFDKNGRKLVLAKGAFAKIIAGSQKGKFCEVQFCDEWSGRVAVKLSNTDEILTLNGLFIVPISKEDYIRESKVINKAKFEQYKLMEENKMGSSQGNVFVDGEPESVAEKYESRCGTSHIKKEVSIHPIAENKRDQSVIKVNHSPNEDISVISESRNNKYETVKSKLKESSSTGKSKYDYERTRSKEKYINQNKPKYVNDYSKDRIEDSSRSDSSDNYDGRKYAKSDRKESKPKKANSHSEMKQLKTKKPINESEESSEENRRKTSRIRNRSRSRSSSIEYDRKYRGKTEEHLKHSRKKRSRKDSSRYSDDDYKVEKISKKLDDDSGRKNSGKIKKKRSHKKKRRDSSSESDYSTEKSKGYKNESKSIKHKSRH